MADVWYLISNTYTDANLNALLAAPGASSSWKLKYLRIEQRAATARTITIYRGAVAVASTYLNAPIGTLDERLFGDGAVDWGTNNALSFQADGVTSYYVEACYRK